jgi:hypothetical protein
MLPRRTTVSLHYQHFQKWCWPVLLGQADSPRRKWLAETVLYTGTRQTTMRGDIDSLSAHVMIVWGIMGIIG